MQSLLCLKIAPYFDGATSFAQPPGRVVKNLIIEIFKKTIDKYKSMWYYIYIKRKKKKGIKKND